MESQVMRAAFENATGKLIEAQSGGTDRDLQTLVRNAELAGYALQDITVRVISKAEYETILAAMPQSAENLRIQALKADADLQNLIDNMIEASPAQIKNYVTANVTDLASARVLLMKMLLIMATLASR